LLFIYFFKCNYNKSKIKIDWLIDWLIGCLTDWPTDWLTDWLAGWLAGWLADWLTDWSWLTDWLTDWLIDWFIRNFILTRWSLITKFWYFDTQSKNYFLIPNLNIGFRCQFRSQGLWSKSNDLWSKESLLFLILASIIGAIINFISMTVKKNSAVDPLMCCD